MVNVQPTNVKLQDRAARIIASIRELNPGQAGELLTQAGSVKAAVVMHQRGLSRADAEARLAKAHGRLREALGRPCPVARCTAGYGYVTTEAKRERRGPQSAEVSRVVPCSPLNPIP